MSGISAMGCQGSKSGAVTEIPPLTEDGKKKVRESWDWYLADDDLSSNTCFIFVKLFSVAPETKALYSFVDEVTEEALVNNERLQKHAARVVHSISLVVNNMEDSETVEKAVKDLGGRHARYGAKEQHIQPVAEGVMYTLKRTLKNKFTKDYEKAWLAVLGMVGQLFQKGLSEQLKQ